MSTYLIQVFGANLIEMEDKSMAERYAEAIRVGFWQCNMTEEPWKMNQQVLDSEGDIHICSDECRDSRTDDDIRVVEVEDNAFDPVLK